MANFLKNLFKGKEPSNNDQSPVNESKKAPAIKPIKEPENSSNKINSLGLSNGTTEEKQYKKMSYRPLPQRPVVVETESSIVVNTEPSTLVEVEVDAEAENERQRRLKNDYISTFPWNFKQQMEDSYTIFNEQFETLVQKIVQERINVQRNRKDRFEEVILSSITQLNTIVASVNAVKNGSFSTMRDYKNSEFNDYSTKLLSMMNWLTDFLNKISSEKFTSFTEQFPITPIDKFAADNSLFLTMMGMLKGDNGEKLVKREIEKNKLQFLSNLNLIEPGDSERLELDFLIVDGKKVYTFEVKDYSAKEIVIDSSGSTHKVTKKGNIESVNIISQVGRSRRILKAILGTEFEIINLIVLTDPDTVIKNNIDRNDLKIIHFGLLNFILSDINQTDQETLKLNYDRILAFSGEERSYPKHDVKAAYDAISKSISTFFSTYPKDLESIYLYNVNEFMKLIDTEKNFLKTNDFSELLRQIEDPADLSPIDRSTYDLYNLFERSTFVLNNTKILEPKNISSNAQSSFSQDLLKDEPTLSVVDFSYEHLLYNRGLSFAYLIQEEKNKAQLADKKTLKIYRFLFDDAIQLTVEPAKKIESAIHVAEVLYQEKLTKYGENHLNTQRGMDDLGYLYGDLGNYEQSSHYYSKLYVQQKRVLGENHIQTLKTGHSYGTALGSAKKYDAASALLETVYQKRYEVLGRGHVDTLESGKFACLYLHKAKKLEEALELGKILYESSKEVLGELHKTTLTRLSDLGVLYSESGELELSLSLGLECYEKSKSVLGEDNSSTLIRLSNLATFYYDLDDYENAEKAFQTLYDCYKETLEPDHIRRILAGLNLACTYCENSKFEEAIALAEPLFISASSKKDITPLDKHKFSRLYGLILAKSNQIDASRSLYEQISSDLELVKDELSLYQLKKLAQWQRLIGIE